MIKRIRNTRIIFLYILFLMSCTLSVSTLQVSAATKKGSIEIHYKGRIDAQGEVDLSGATFTLFQIQSAENGELVWNEEFASAGISLLIMAFYGQSTLPNNLTSLDVVALIIFAIDIFILRKWKSNPLWVMLCSGIVGIVLYLLV